MDVEHAIIDTSSIPNLSITLAQQAAQEIITIILLSETGRHPPAVMSG